MSSAGETAEKKREVLANLFQIASLPLFVVLVLVPAVILLVWIPGLINFVRGYVLGYDGWWYIGIIGFYIVWWACTKRGEASPKDPPLEERKLGADALRSQVTSGILASSFVLAAATFLFSKPSGVETAAVGNALVDIQRATAWLVVSLLIGLWNAFSIAGRVNISNVAKEPYYNLLSVGQLFAILFGVLNLTSGMSWMFAS